MVVHKVMSLFDAPVKSMIVHACNSQGMWGSGIAKPFADNYKESYADYQRFCKLWNERRNTACGLGGFSQGHESEKHHVGWIVTSHNYGAHKDSPELIKIHTTLALKDLCQQIHAAHLKSEFPDDESIEVYSNKFNSGLFGVPWEQSELILETVLKDYKRIKWIVCSEV